jgi:hypothetical protein
MNGIAFLLMPFVCVDIKGKLFGTSICVGFSCKQVTTLSDIINGFGTHITTAARNGIIDASRPHYFTYPNQG